MNIAITKIERIVFGKIIESQAGMDISTVLLKLCATLALITIKGNIYNNLVLIKELNDKVN